MSAVAIEFMAIGDGLHQSFALQVGVQPVEVVCLLFGLQNNAYRIGFLFLYCVNGGLFTQTHTKRNVCHMFSKAPFVNAKKIFLWEYKETKQIGLGKGTSCSGTDSSGMILL